MRKNPFFLFLLSLIFTGIFFSSCGHQGNSVKPRQEEQIYDPEHLLTDNELKTLIDPDAPGVDARWVNWIKEHTIPIRSLTSNNFEDLQFLKKTIGDRRIVQLGENGHGVAEFDEIKVRLIKFLHQEMGFEVIAFESGIFDCFDADRNARTSTPFETMNDSIFGVWKCAETSLLFYYLKESKSTAKPLILAGFDIQRSGSWRNRPVLFKEVIEKISPEYAKECYEQEKIHVAEDNPYDYYSYNHDELLLYYTRMVEFFDQNMPVLQSAFLEDPVKPHFARLSAWQCQAFIRHLTSTIHIRDSLMAEALVYIADKIYSDKKIIVWAHNTHISHDGVLYWDDLDIEDTMGTYIYNKYSSELYTIGLYMYRGICAGNNRETYLIRTPITNSLEAVFYRSFLKYQFLDLLNQNQEQGNTWIFEDTPTNYWGMINKYLVPKDNFNAIIFIDTVKAPEYFVLY